jgi:hypothetical protein
VPQPTTLPSAPKLIEYPKYISRFLRRYKTPGKRNGDGWIWLNGVSGN